MFAIELYLEETYANLIRAMWQKLADEGLTSSMLDNGCQPHVTLGVFESLEIEATIDRLDSFFTEVEVPRVTFEVLGCFPTTKVLHCTPTVTSSLLALHREFHRVMASVVSHPRAHYQPGRWVPHCTLAIDLKSELLPDTFEAVLPNWQPFQSRFGAVALVKPVPKTVELWVKDIRG